MFASRLINSPLKQTIGPTSSKALIYVASINHSSHLQDPARVGVSRSSSDVRLANEYFDQFSEYCHMIDNAKRTARRSILINHSSIQNIDLIKEFDNVEHVYSIERKTRHGPAWESLIEFKSELDAEKVAKQARYDEFSLPVDLKILDYRVNHIKATNNSSSLDNIDKDEYRPFPVHHVTISNDRFETQKNFGSYSDLVAHNMMSLVNLKLRFITLVNFESILCSGVFGEYELMPFGSSVIDLGCDSGDLDLLVTRKGNHREFINNKITSTVGSQPTSSNSKLVHLSRPLPIGTETSQNPTVDHVAMKWFETVLKDFTPLTDYNRVFFIRNAKVPIIKFLSRRTHLDCDLSFNLGLDDRSGSNYSGVVMSQLLYSLCRNNDIFSALAIYLRIYAKIARITDKGPRVKMTSFQYLTLIIFYLQRTSIVTEVKSGMVMFDFGRYKDGANQQPIIPPFRELLDSSLSDQHQIRAIKLDRDQLNAVMPRIIKGFFKFYSEFDFSNYLLNLYDSKMEKKERGCPIHVENPIDRERNVCYNVDDRALAKFIEEVEYASNVLHGDLHEVTPLSIIDLMREESSMQKQVNGRFSHKSTLSSKSIASKMFT